MTPVSRPEVLARISARLKEEQARLGPTLRALSDGLARWGQEPQDVVTVHWVGGLVHDFYTGLEKAFSEISPEMNGQEPERESWHRGLLHAMTLDLPGYRPPVLRRELEAPLLELLRFRHLYRNLYSFELRWERVRALAEQSLAIWPDVESDLRAFIVALDSMAS